MEELKNKNSEAEIKIDNNELLNTMDEINGRLDDISCEIDNSPEDEPEVKKTL